MQEIKTGDPLAPVTVTHVLGLPEINGVIFRMEFITRGDQPMDQAEMSPNYVLKSELARTIGRNLIDAADRLDNVVASAANEPAKAE